MTRAAARAGAWRRMSSAVRDTRKNLRVTVWCAVAAALALGLAACASGSASSGSAGATGSASATASNASLLQLQGTYTGPETDVPNTYANPTVKPGTKFVVGWLNPNGVVPGLNAEQQYAQQETAKLGGTFIAMNANASITLQVSQFNDLLAEHVSAIMVNPNDVGSLTPDLKQAAAAHIPVISVSGAIAGQPAWAGYETNLVQGEDQAAYYNAAAVAKADPHATFAVMGYAAPIPVLEYWAQRAKYWGEKLGLHFVDETDTTATTPSAQATAMSAILARDPNVQAVFCFNDEAAESAVSVARQAGKHVLVSGTEGDTTARQLIKAGEMFSTFAFNWQALGAQAVIAGYDLVTHQQLPLPVTIAALGTLVTKANPGV
jgi:ABC-type sugar transport system substrate-binding protein